MSRWYRAYEGTVTDPKLGEAALMAESSRAVSVATWHALLESAASAQSEGRFDTTPRRIAAALCEPVKVIEAIFEAFAEIGLIDDGAIAAWSRRQFEGDASATRTKRWRDKKKTTNDVTVTSHPVTVTAPYTETDTERTKAGALDAEKASVPAPVVQTPSSEEPIYATDLDRLWGEGKITLTAWGMPAKQTGSMIGKWLRDSGDDPPRVLDAIRRCEQQRTADPIPFITRLLQAQRPSHERNRQDRSSTAALEKLRQQVDVGRFG